MLRHSFATCWRLCILLNPVTVITGAHALHGTGACGTMGARLIYTDEMAQYRRPRH